MFIIQIFIALWALNWFNIQGDWPAHQAARHQEDSQWSRKNSTAGQVIHSTVNSITVLTGRRAAVWEWEDERGVSSQIRMSFLDCRSSHSYMSKRSDCCRDITVWLLEAGWLQRRLNRLSQEFLCLTETRFFFYVYKWKYWMTLAKSV